MKVCIVAEGCYPYVVGGVSGWINSLIKSFPNVEFILLAIVANRSFRGKFVYELPENLTQVYEVYLEDSEWEGGDRKRKRRKKVHISRKEYDELLNMVLNRKTDWGVIFDLFHKKRLSVDDLLMGEDFFLIARECYNRNYSDINFSDFLWTLRSIYLPMFWTLKMDVPKADLYHCVATGYSGILGSMAKHFHGSSLLISEHGIYTREREEELIKAAWVRGVYKNIWIEQFKKMSLLAYEKADTVTCLYDHARELQIELGCPEEKIKVTPNGINTEALADPEKLKYWMPVDWYNGGMEHVTRHMIYSRFWHHFLYDLGVVNTPEPYAKRSIQGLILGPDGDKMSKSKGNVVDPLDIVEEYGADTLRTYVLFMGDYGAATPWSENSVKGCKKFLDRVAGLTDILSEESVSDELEMKLHRTIKKVSSDIENLKFNTAIASLMTLINEITAEGHLSKDDLTIFIKLLSPFAPHICEEIWEFIGGEGLLAVSEWPKYDEGKTIAKTVEIGVQVNGKVRGTIVIPNGCEKEKAFEIAKADERIASFLEGKNLIKEIYVPNKIVNFVAK